MAFTVSAIQAQKKHVYHDTTKSVSERIEYEPDTIPVYFKEVTMGAVKIYDIYSTTDGSPKTSKPRDSTQLIETWQKGFVVWQTYVKYPNWGTSGTLSSYNGTFTLNKQPEYYKDPYEPSKSIPGIFLYADKKTHCKNLIIYSIKR